MIDFNKHRQTSSYNNVSNILSNQRTLLKKQAVIDFDEYQRNAPNTDFIYVNDSITPILGTFIDVSDLEIRQDTKWLLTSLENKINAGDIVTWRDRKWMVVYDKEKNTGNCFKVKVQQCTYPLKFVTWEDEVNKIPRICSADSVVLTYLTDFRDLKQPFPTENGTTFISVQFNEYTEKIKPESKLWIYNTCFVVQGVDISNIDHYIGKGFLKFTCRPDKVTTFDNPELQIADYYKYYNKNAIQPPVSSGAITVNISSKVIPINSKVTFSATTLNNDKITYSFANSDTLGCTMKNLSNNTCEFTSSINMGVVQIKMIINGDSNNFEILKLAIK